MRKLWGILKEGEHLDQIQNDQWTIYGFQNKNPATDFRGGGLISLLHLMQFSTYFPEKVKAMITPDNQFFLAISSINVTFYLLKYFHLFKPLDINKDRQDMCSRKALKNFCTMLRQDEDVLQQYHDIILIDLFEKCWLTLKNQGKSIMEFGQALVEVKRKLDHAINQRRYANFL